MITPEVPAYEVERIKALKSLKLLDTPTEERFDRITRIVKTIFKVPIVLVSLVDVNRQWFKSCLGLDVSETSREVYFCGHAINEDKPFIIPDACNDVRFYDNPLVTGDPYIRFYAGIKVKDQNGYGLGTLCIIDDKPRNLSEEEITLLQELAKLVEVELNNQELLNASKRIRESEEKYHNLVEVLEEGVILQDQDSTILACNSSAQQILGLTADQMMGLTSMDPNWRVIHEDGSPFPGEEHPIPVSLRTGKPQTNVIMGVYRPDNSLTWISVNALPLFRNDPDDNSPELPYAAVASFVDISRHKEKADKLSRQAHYDNLTGLPNRVLFRDRLSNSLSNAFHNQVAVAVGFVDLDYFKQVNDSLGHAVGDALLLEAGIRMKNCVRHTDTVARLGGDEFAIILNGVGNKEQAAAIAHKLVEAIAKEFIINGHKLNISASIGISLYPMDDTNSDELLKLADYAMYEAKLSGKNTYKVYDFQTK